jgi:hypothetical protein
MTTTPPPGIYYNVPFADYLQWDAISNSALHAAAKSMAHFKCRKPPAETRPMILGTLTHTAQFESSWVNQRFAFMPDYAEQVQRDRASWFDGVMIGLEENLKAAKGANDEASVDQINKAIEKHRKEKRQYERPSATSEYRKLVDAFERANAARTVVTEQEFTDLVGMVRALSDNKRAKAYLKGGQYEVSIVAKDPVTGLLCKGRLDHVDWGRGLVTDLKSSANVHKFESMISDYSYHRQLALYGDMPTWIEGGNDELHTRAIVAIESSEPWCVRSAELDEEAIETGREEYRFLLDSIAEAKASGKWPGYADPDLWRLPHWHKRNRAAVGITIGGETVSV